MRLTYGSRIDLRQLFICGWVQPLPAIGDSIVVGIVVKVLAHRILYGNGAALEAFWIRAVRIFGHRITLANRVIHRNRRHDLSNCTHRAKLSSYK
jgi:PAS domain-containing protein